MTTGRDTIADSDTAPPPRSCIDTSRPPDADAAVRFTARNPTDRNAAWYDDASPEPDNTNEPVVVSHVPVMPRSPLTLSRRVDTASPTGYTSSSL